MLAARWSDERRRAARAHPSSRSRTIVSPRSIPRRRTCESPSRVPVRESHAGGLERERACMTFTGQCAVARQLVRLDKQFARPDPPQVRALRWADRGCTTFTGPCAVRAARSPRRTSALKPPLDRPLRWADRACTTFAPRWAARSPRRTSSLVRAAAALADQRIDRGIVRCTQPASTAARCDPSSTDLALDHADARSCPRGHHRDVTTGTEHAEPRARSRGGSVHFDDPFVGPEPRLARALRRDDRAARRSLPRAVRAARSPGRTPALV